MTPTLAPASPPAVAVCIVTYNSAPDLAGCLETVIAQSHRPLELIIVDCASGDDSVDVAQSFPSGDVPKRVRPLADNLGFSGGMNAAFAATDAPLLLTLNADVRLDADYVSRLVARVGPAEQRISTVTGRLLRFREEGEPQLLDACGMHLNWRWRHLDRGSEKIDQGQLDRLEKVFGATGAATLWVRAALEDVALRDVDPQGEIFAEAFHSYREDAELAFRLQGRGWHALYEPAAVSVHRRAVGSGRRTRVAPEINRSSLKNRYLLRIYHQSLGNFLYTLPWTLSRDVMAFIWVVARERTSWPAYPWLLRNWRASWRRRRWIRRRLTHPWAVEKWFLKTSESVASGALPRRQGTAASSRQRASHPEDDAKSSVDGQAP